MQLHIFVFSAVDEGEWSPSLSSRLTPDERFHGTRWIRGVLWPRADLDLLVKRKSFLRPFRDPKPFSPYPSLS